MHSEQPVSPYIMHLSTEYTTLPYKEIVGLKALQWCRRLCLMCLIRNIRHRYYMKQYTLTQTHMYWHNIQKNFLLWSSNSHQELRPESHTATFQQVQQKSKACTSTDLGIILTTLTTFKLKSNIKIFYRTLMQCNTKNDSHYIQWTGTQNSQTLIMARFTQSEMTLTGN
jgi:hypothetical protein